MLCGRGDAIADNETGVTIKAGSGRCDWTLDSYTSSPWEREWLEAGQDRANNVCPVRPLPAGADATQPDRLDPSAHTHTHPQIEYGLGGEPQHSCYAFHPSSVAAIGLSLRLPSLEMLCRSDAALSLCPG